MSSWRSMPTEMDTPRLNLGPWHDSDLAAYETLVHERDPRTAAARDKQLTREELLAEIAHQTDTLTRTGIGLLAVRVADQFAGYCGLTVGHSTFDEPEIAYELLRTYHGNGYATEAASATVRAAADTGRARLWATVRPWNDPSFRVLEKVGFERTARATVDDFGESIWCSLDL